MEDMFILPRIFLKAERIMLVTDLLYYYCQNSGSIMNSANLSSYIRVRYGKYLAWKEHEAMAQAHSGLGLVHLGLALKLMGDEGRAKSALDAGIKKPRLNEYWWGDYGTSLRDWAQMYVLLDKHGLKPEGRENLVGLVAGYSLASWLARSFWPKNSPAASSTHRSSGRSSPTTCFATPRAPGRASPSRSAAPRSMLAASTGWRPSTAPPCGSVPPVDPLCAPT